MRILFFGITQFAVQGLKKLIALDQAPVAVVLSPIHSQDIDTLKQICREHRIEVYTQANVNDPSFLSTVRTHLRPDLILTFTFDQKLSPGLIESAANAINMHPSFLPYYRGHNPYFWPIANAETFTGVSYHFLTENFDQGDIILQEQIPIRPTDTCGLVIFNQEKIAVTLLARLLQMIESGNPLPRRVQPQGDYPKAPKPTLRDHFIRWEQPGETILNLIRALNPYGGAYTQYKDIVLAIYQASLAHYHIPGVPGTILSLGAQGPVIKTGSGAVVLQILAAGKKYLLSGNDFVENERVAIGDKLISWE